MIKIEFTGDDIQKLKNEVREFAIIHLGINFEKAAATITPPPPCAPSPDAPVPEKAPMHQMTENAALPPRNKPGRKPKGAVPAPNPANETVAIPPEDFMTNAAAEELTPDPTVTAAGPTPTQDEVNDAIRNLVQKDNNNLNRAREFLARFKVSKGKDLKEEQRADFIALVQEALAK